MSVGELPQVRQSANGCECPNRDCVGCRDRPMSRKAAAPNVENLNERLADHAVGGQPDTGKICRGNRHLRLRVARPIRTVHSSVLPTLVTMMDMPSTTRGTTVVSVCADQCADYAASDPGMGARQRQTCLPDWSPEQTGVWAFHGCDCRTRPSIVQRLPPHRRLRRRTGPLLNVVRSCAATALRRVAGKPL